MTWLQSSKAGKGNFYKESFEKRWPSLIVPSIQSQLEASELLSTKHELGRRVIEDFSAAAASKLLEQEMREVVSSGCCLKCKCVLHFTLWNPCCVSN